MVCIQPLAQQKSSVMLKLHKSELLIWDLLTKIIFFWRAEGALQAHLAVMPAGGGIYIQRVGTLLLGEDNADPTADWEESKNKCCGS